MYNKLKQIAAAALFAAAVTATTVQAQEIQAMAPEAVASVNGPGVIYVKFGGPGMETALDAAPEGTVELCQGPGSAASGQGAGGGAVQGWTEEDLYVLAHVICGEAQNCPDDEQRYIGSVVLNRGWNTTPLMVPGYVVFQSGQYSCTRGGNYYRTPTEANWANARWLLENGSVLPGNVVFQSGGRQGKGVYLRTGYHYYCY